MGDEVLIFARQDDYLRLNRFMQVQDGKVLVQPWSLNKAEQAALGIPSSIDYTVRVPLEDLKAVLAGSVSRIRSPQQDDENS